MCDPHLCKAHLNTFEYTPPQKELVPEEDDFRIFVCHFLRYDVFLHILFWGKFHCIWADEFVKDYKTSPIKTIAMGKSSVNTLKKPGQDETESERNKIEPICV